MSWEHNDAKIRSRLLSISCTRFLDHLRQFEEVFTVGFVKNDCYAGNQVKLHSSLVTPEERTSAVGDAIKSLGELIPGFRNEVILTSSVMLQI